VARIAAQVASALGEVPGAGPAPLPYRRVAAAAGASPDSLAAWLRDGWETGATLLGPDEARIGAWLATARLAATRRDAAFFRSAAGRGAIVAIGPLASGAGAEPSDAFTRLAALTERTDAPDWAAVRRDLDALLLALGD
jgi:hypothetical protein